MSALVLVIEDDPTLQADLSGLLEGAGYQVKVYETTEAFLAALNQMRPACVVSEMHFRDGGGPGLQGELSRLGSDLPVIFLTAEGDVAETVRAMKAGAAAVVAKPWDPHVLLDQVRSALAASELEQTQRAIRESNRSRLSALTEREREILLLAVQGAPNKEIARRLGISYRTVEVHRSRILSKTGAASLVELARLVGDAGGQTGDLST